MHLVERHEKNKQTEEIQDRGSVLDKLLDINRDYAILMINDMLLAGIHTVKKMNSLYTMHTTVFRVDISYTRKYFVPFGNESG